MSQKYDVWLIINFPGAHCYVFSDYNTNNVFFFLLTPMFRCTSLTPGPCCDRFKLHIPYAGETLKCKWHHSPICLFIKWIRPILSLWGCSIATYIYWVIVGFWANNICRWDTVLIRLVCKSVCISMFPRLIYSKHNSKKSCWVNNLVHFNTFFHLFVCCLSS